MANSTPLYSAKHKFQVVLEANEGEKTPGQIGKAFGLYPNSVRLWKQAFWERAPPIFQRGSAAREAATHVSGGSSDQEPLWPGLRGGKK